jgi:hypothetical protein
VAISLEGDPELVNRDNGVVEQTLTSLLITAKPNDIPSGLSVDISGLEIGGALRVGDITLPAGVTTSVDPEEQVVAAHRGISDEEFEASESEAAGEVEGEEGEAGEAEGEAGEAAGGDAAGDGGGGGGGDGAAGGDEG